jgi:hypothetical protein
MAIAKLALKNAASISTTQQWTKPPNCSDSCQNSILSNTLTFAKLTGDREEC